MLDDDTMIEESKRAYRAIYRATKLHGYAEKEQLLKKGYSQEAINNMLRSGIIYEPREGWLKPSSL